MRRLHCLHRCPVLWKLGKAAVQYAQRLFGVMGWVLQQRHSSWPAICFSEETAAVAAITAGVVCMRSEAASLDGFQCSGCILPWRLSLSCLPSFFLGSLGFGLQSRADVLFHRCLILLELAMHSGLCSPYLSPVPELWQHFGVTQQS